MARSGGFAGGPDRPDPLAFGSSAMLIGVLIELHTFRLAAGADEAAFLAADARVQAELSSRPGFVRRTTARGADGGWLVVLLWDSAKAADASGGAADLSARVELDPVGVGRYETLD